ncbi:MurR/RpiR family transcriptional regulator [Streptomyces sp. NPDC055078]
MTKSPQYEAGTGATPTVADRIRGVQESLSPAELKLSRALLANYPAAGLESTNALAQKVGISAPTVLRFIGRIGFAKYRDFQGALRAEVQARRASPLTLPARITADSATSEISTLVADTASEVIRHTFHGLPEHEFERAVTLLCDSANRIVLFGGRFSHLLATYLDLHLRLMRPRTSVHVPHPNNDPGFLLDIGRRTVCVVFDFRRYQKDTIALARAAHSGGAKVVLITDPWLSPAADFADIVIPARVEAVGSFDSIVAPTALVEALVFAVHARLGGAADQRMRSIEAGFGDITTD